VSNGRSSKEAEGNLMQAAVLVEPRKIEIREA